MTGGDGVAPGWFDIHSPDFQRILELVSASDITFLRLRTGDLELVIAREDRPGDAAAPAPGAAPTVRAGPDRGARGPEEPRAAPVAVPPPSDPAPSAVPVLAPLAGIFYESPEPGRPPFVSVGTKVTEDSTVGLIETMKVFTAVRAGIRGLVVEIRVQSGEAVRRGQPLFSVVPDSSSTAEP